MTHRKFINFENKKYQIKVLKKHVSHIYFHVKRWKLEGVSQQTKKSENWDGCRAATCHLPTESEGPINCFKETTWKLKSLNCLSPLISVVGFTGFTTHISLCYQLWWVLQFTCYFRHRMTTYFRHIIGLEKEKSERKERKKQKKKRRKESKQEWKLT